MFTMDFLMFCQIFSWLMSYMVFYGCLRWSVNVTYTLRTNLTLKTACK